MSNVTSVTEYKVYQACLQNKHDNREGAECCIKCGDALKFAVFKVTYKVHSSWLFMSGYSDFEYEFIRWLHP